MAWEPRSRSGGARPRAPEGLRHPPPHRLLDLPPLGVPAWTNALPSPRPSIFPPSGTAWRRSRDRRYWRSLEELAETDEFVEFLEYEFPRQAAGHSRGRLGLEPAALPEADERLARARRPRRLHPAARRAHRPLREAARARSSSASRSTSRPPCRSAASASACWPRATRAARPRSRAIRSTRRASARPTSPRRRRCSGSTIRDRSQVVINAGEIRTWERASCRRSAPRARPRRRRAGAGLRILTETVTSPTLAAQLNALRRDLPAGALAPVGPARAATPPARAPAWPSAATSTRATASTRPRRRLARRRLHDLRTGPPALRSRLQRAPPGRAGSPRDERGSTPSRARRPSPAASPTIACRVAPSDVEPIARAIAAGVGSPVRRRRRQRAGRGPCAPGSPPLVADLRAHRGTVDRRRRRRSSRRWSTRWRTR